MEALRSGHLGGAALDVFASEPLPGASPLWDMPNVLVTPHSMSTALGENELLVDLFCDNLRRYLAGAALRNVFDRERGYARHILRRVELPDPKRSAGPPGWPNARLDGPPVAVEYLHADLPQ